MKKIHFVSLRDCYSAEDLHQLPAYRIYSDLTRMIPRTSSCYIGPYFTSMTEAAEIAQEAFGYIADQTLKDLIPDYGPFDLVFGTEELLRQFVPLEVLEDVYSYSLFSQLPPADHGLFLAKVRKRISELFAIIPSDKECLMFTVFPFGEIIFQNFAENKDTVPVFRFLEGFSLLSDGEIIRAELLT